MNSKHVQDAWLIHHGWSYLSDEELPWQKKWMADDDESLGLRSSRASTAAIAVATEMAQQLEEAS